MNRLLLSPEELCGRLATVRGRRARHVSEVLRKEPGQLLQVGVVGLGLGQAEILSLRQGAMEADSELSCELGELFTPPAPSLHLILALPRPKALSRILQIVGSLGVAHLDLIDAYRVEKSYFDSPRLAPERVQEDLWLGVEQGAHCWLPSWELTRGFGHWFQQVLPKRQEQSPAQDVVLHPGAGLLLSELPSSVSSPLRLALGPEGGWTEGELRALQKAHFLPVDLASPILKTETALACAAGQWFLLREQARRASS